MSDLRKQVAQVIADNREAVSFDIADAILAIARPAIIEQCARVAEEHIADGARPVEYYWNECATAITAAIRALKGEK